MSVQTEIARIAQAKTDIKNVVNSKVANTITNQTIDAFPPLIDSSIAAYKNLIPWIEGGGSSFTIDNVEAGKLDLFEIEGNIIQGKLPSEYTQVDYIESDGWQYIDTGVNADNNLRVVLDIAYTLPTSANQNIGAINMNNSPYSRYHILPQNGYFKLYLNNSDYNTINSDTEKHLFDINPASGNVIVDNQSFTIPSNISDTGLNFYLFGRNSTGVIYCSKIKQWGCKMYYNDELVRDFIPCYRNSDNKVGLYDIVNGVFYTNSRQESSTDFTYGTLAPTPDAPMEIEMVTSKNTINVSGTNLIGFDDLAETTQNGITYSIKDNMFTLNGTASAFVGGININQWKLKKAGNYTLKIEKISGEWTKGIIGISLRDSSNSQLNYHQVAYNTSGGSVTREDNQNVIDNVVKETFFINKDSVFNNFKFRMIFNEGSAAQDYEPYHNQDYEINLGDIELCKIGDYKDVIFKNNQLSEYYDSTLDEDSWYIKKAIDKIILDGTETWELSTVDGNIKTQRFKITAEKQHVVNIGYSNNFRVKTENISVYEDTELVQLSSSVSNKYIGIQINKDRLISNTIEDFKTWLSTHNVEVYYVLVTPTYEKITNSTLISQLEAIETETGTNIFEVSNDNNILPNLYILTEKKDSYNNWKKREGID